MQQTKESSSRYHCEIRGRHQSAPGLEQWHHEAFRYGDRKIIKERFIERVTPKQFKPGSAPSASPLTVSPETEEEFYRLAREWRLQTMHISLANEKASSFLYHQLIGMGKEILPLVFKELETATSDWFWLLAAIARDDAPTIPREDAGRVQKITKIWMDWGRERGYVPM